LINLQKYLPRPAPILKLGIINPNGTGRVDPRATTNKFIMKNKKVFI
jgi:hypothetical protein